MFDSLDIRCLLPRLSAANIQVSELGDVSCGELLQKYGESNVRISLKMLFGISLFNLPCCSYASFVNTGLIDFVVENTDGPDSHM